MVEIDGFNVYNDDIGVLDIGYTETITGTCSVENTTALGVIEDEIRALKGKMSEPVVSEMGRDPNNKKRQMYMIRFKLLTRS